MAKVNQNAENGKKETKRHRGHGQGTIIERNGKFRGQVLVDGHRLSKTFATKPEAQRWIRKTVTDADDGLLPVDGGKITVGEYLDKWLVAITPSIKPKTIHQYEMVIRLHLKPTLGTLKLVNLRADHLQSLSAQKHTAELAARTIGLILAVAHHALADAVGWQLVPHNVADAVTRPKPRRNEMTVWTPEQARAFLAGVSGDRYEALYHVALSCGLRIGEMFGLRWDDADLDRGRLHVQRTLQRIGKGHGLTVGEPKTDRSRRNVALSGSAVAALRRWRVRQIEERLVAGPQWQDTGYVFTSSHGKPVERSNFQRSFDRAAALLGVPRIRIHDLRHTCATLLLTRGVHPKIVSEMLGHATVALDERQLELPVATTRIAA